MFYRIFLDRCYKKMNIGEMRQACACQNVQELLKILIVGEDINQY